MGDDQAVVLLDGVSYSLMDIPPSTSKVVKSEKVRLLGSIDLEALVDDLGRLGNCVRIAYHGVAGYTELQIKVQRIGYKVTKLCDRSAITISQFKKASETVLLSLQSTYQYLLDGLENMAVYTLADVAETVEGMSKAASELCTEFNKQSEHVIATVEEIAQKHGMEEEKMEEERKEMKAMYTALDKEAHSLKNDLIFGPFLVIFPTAVRVKMKQLQERQLRIALEFSKHVQNSKDRETQVEAAIESLYKAHSALESLAAVMMKDALFWEKMLNHCKELAKGKIPKEERLEVCTSHAIKLKAVLDDICSVYVERIKLTQQELYTSRSRYVQMKHTKK